MSKNPTKITVVTPDGEKTLENVETWWREDGELVIEFQDEDRDRFPQEVLIR